MGISSKTGTYSLVLRSDANADIRIGRWGQLDVCPGYYIYVGSALGPGGVSARVARHCRTNKAKHWHIDYLREHTSLIAVWYRHSPLRLEHHWAKSIAELDEFEPAPGFGCSDCKCDSHLFYSVSEPGLAEFAAAVGGPVISWTCDQLD